jgi:hypothetical protein
MALLAFFSRKMQFLRGGIAVQLTAIDLDDWENCDVLINVQIKMQ